MSLELKTNRSKAELDSIPSHPLHHIYLETFSDVSHPLHFHLVALETVGYNPVEKSNSHL